MRESTCLGPLGLNMTSQWVWAVGCARQRQAAGFRVDLLRQVRWQVCWAMWQSSSYLPLP